VQGRDRVGQGVYRIVYKTRDAERIFEAMKVAHRREVYERE